MRQEEAGGGRRRQYEAGGGRRKLDRGELGFARAPKLFYAVLQMNVFLAAGFDKSAKSKITGRMHQLISKCQKIQPSQEVNLLRWGG